MFFVLMCQETVERSLRNLLASLQKDVVDNGIKQYTDKILLEGKPKNIVEVFLTISC
jgi:hypothetical protein